MSNYDIEKWICPEKDFDMMVWHDAVVYGFYHTTREYSNRELIFDIDYTCNAIPVLKSSEDSFNVPATLVFEKVHDLEVNLKERFERRDWGGLYIYDIVREKYDEDESIRIDKSLYKWIIIFDEDETITFLSTGYKQYIREKPKKEKDMDRNREISFYRGSIF